MCAVTGALWGGGAEGTEDWWRVVDTGEGEGAIDEWEGRRQISGADERHREDMDVVGGGARGGE